MNQTKIIEERLATLGKINKYLETVDIEEMGVQQYGAEQIYHMCAHEENKPFYAFIGTFLSPQTRDQQTYAAVKKLHDALGELNPKIIDEAPLETIVNCIKAVSFYTTKAKRLKKCCSIIIEKHNGIIPSTKDELIALPGVGPKIASLILSIAFDKSELVAVDTHVFVVSQRLNWANGTTPEKVRIQIESWLPKEEWTSFNKTLVAFGQCCCRKNSPKCIGCPIRDQCNYFKTKS